jgi:hypothetical protein
VLSETIDRFVSEYQALKSAAALANDNTRHWRRRFEEAEQDAMKLRSRNLDLHAQVARAEGALKATSAQAEQLLDQLVHASRLAIPVYLQHPRAVTKITFRGGITDTITVSYDDGTAETRAYRYLGSSRDGNVYEMTK